MEQNSLVCRICSKSCRIPYSTLILDYFLVMLLCCIGKCCVYVYRLFEALQVHNDTVLDKSRRMKCLLLDIDERLVCFYDVIYYKCLKMLLFDVWSLEFGLRLHIAA